MILKSILRRWSGNMPFGRELSSSSSDGPDIGENPCRWRFYLNPSWYEWQDSPWPRSVRSTVKRMAMKPPSFNGNGSVLTFRAKFDNFAEFTWWLEREKFHCLTNAL